MTRRELINTVKTKLDEVSALDGMMQPFGLPDDRPVDMQVDMLLDESAREVLMKAPGWRIAGVSEAVAVHDNGDGSGYVVLPLRFIRLLAFKMGGWKRPVTGAVESGSGVAVVQGNPYLRGGRCKPVCVLAHRGGERVMEYYSVRGQHRVERFVYVADMLPEDLPGELQEVAGWWCAARVLQVTGRTAEAQMAYERGNSLL